MAIKKPHAVPTVELEDIMDCRNNYCAVLTSAELDLVILGTIHSSINCDDNNYKLLGKIPQKASMNIDTFLFSWPLNLSENVFIYALASQDKVL